MPESNQSKLMADQNKALLEWMDYEHGERTKLLQKMHVQAKEEYEEAKRIHTALREKTQARIKAALALSILAFVLSVASFLV